MTHGQLPVLPTITQACRKDTVYQANGLTALMFTPDLFQGNWPNRLLGQIEEVLGDRLRTFRDRRSLHIGRE